MTIPNMIASTCAVLFVVAVCIPLAYHIGHFVWRIIDDLEYEAKEHAFFIRFFRGNFKDGKYWLHYTKNHPSMNYGEKVIGWYFVLLSVLSLIGFTAFIPNILYVYAVIFLVVGVIYTARGVRRLQKALKKHIDDKEAHK